MANEIVKYSNQFNAQALRRFTALDLDLLMAIAARVRDKEIDEVTFTFEELRQLAHVKKNLTDKELAARIVEVNDRLLACRFRFQDDSRTVQFTLFSGFETDWKTAKLLVAVNPRFSFLLNDLTSQFTRFELAEFTALKSSYAKETYRRLKQYRQTGVWKVSLEEFRRLLDVPKSYRTCDLNERVLKPIQAELGELLGLRIHKKYAKRGGRGRSSLVGFEFEFDPEKVPGGVSAPRVELSPGVVADAARKSLRDAARADERAEAERRRVRRRRTADVLGWSERHHLGLRPVPRRQRGHESHRRNRPAHPQIAKVRSHNRHGSGGIANRASHRTTASPRPAAKLHAQPPAHRTPDRSAAAGSVGLARTAQPSLCWAEISDLVRNIFPTCRKYVVSSLL